MYIKERGHSSSREGEIGDNCGAKHAYAGVGATCEEKELVSYEPPDLEGHGLRIWRRVHRLGERLIEPVKKAIEMARPSTQERLEKLGGIYSVNVWA